MVAPAALVLAVFHYLPVLGNVVAFQDYNPYLGDSGFAALIASPWIGLSNFRDLFADPAFWDALWNTLAITAFQLVFFFPLPIALAILLDSVLGHDRLLAALATIDPHLYEAAAVDGAGRSRRLWHITLPGLRPVIVLLLLILRLGDALSVGFEQFLLQRDAVGRQAAEVLDTFVYHQAIATGDYGFGAAAGLFKALVGLVLILVANKVAHVLGEQGVYSRV
jgi:ABC-type polysaccharide transport system permease subunit